MQPDISLLALAAPPRVAYLAVFGLAALLSFASLARIDQVRNAETRRGLAALLAGSGLWATGHVGFFLAPTPALSLAFYQFGLVVGFATVGAWLYFVSAYTNRSYHREPRFRRAALAVFLLIIAVKLTNPVHHLYFTHQVVTEPFRHVAVQTGALHWVVMGLSYTLSGIGYFAIFERFAKVSYDTRPLAVLVGLTGLPIVFDVIGAASGLLVDVTYEPIGVAVFAVGFVFVFLDRFQSIRLAGQHDDPVLVLDEAGHVSEFNDSAADLFGGRLDQDAIGERLQDVLPDLPDPAQAGTPIYEREDESGTRYYSLSSNPFSTDETALGEMLILSEVTHREQYRRELERQNERLEEFAGMVSHDLRSPLTVAQGHLQMIPGPEERVDEQTREHVEHATEALDRMNEIIEEVLALARQGQPIDETEPVFLEAVARDAWSMIDSAEATLEVTGDLRFHADEDRLQQLLENLFRNAIDHVGPSVTVTVGKLEDEAGVFVADDGPGIPADEREEVFQTGFTTSQSGTGFGLAIAEEIAEAHGWAIAVGEAADGGASFEITGLERE